MNEKFFFFAFLFLSACACESQKIESVESADRVHVRVDRVYLRALEAEVRSCRSRTQMHTYVPQTQDPSEFVALPGTLTMCEVSFPHATTDLGEVQIVVSESKKNPKQKTLPPIVNVQLGQFAQTALTEEQIDALRKQIHILGELAMRCLANAVRDEVSDDSSDVTLTFRIPVRVILENGRVWETGLEDAYMPFASKEELMCIDRSIYKLVHLSEDEERHIFTFVLVLKIRVSKLDSTKHKRPEDYVPLHIDPKASHP